MSNPRTGESKLPYPTTGPAVPQDAPPPYAYPAQTQPVGAIPQVTSTNIYNPQPGVPHVAISVGNPPILLGPRFVLGPFPANIECPNCQNTVVTDIQRENGLLTWLLVGGICLFGCWLGCCLIPTCVDDCKDVIHICPNCKRIVGRYNRIS